MLGSQPIINRLLKYVLYSQAEHCRMTMLEMYVRRVYHFYRLSDVAVASDGAVTWNFFKEDVKVSMGMTSSGSYDSLTALLTEDNRSNTPSESA